MSQRPHPPCRLDPIAGRLAAGAPTTSPTWVAQDFVADQALNRDRGGPPAPVRESGPESQANRDLMERRDRGKKVPAISRPKFHGAGERHPILGLQSKQRPPAQPRVEPANRIERRRPRPPRVPATHSEERVGQPPRQVAHRHHAGAPSDAIAAPVREPRSAIPALAVGPDAGSNLPPRPDHRDIDAHSREQALGAGADAERRRQRHPSTCHVAATDSRLRRE